MRKPCSQRDRLVPTDTPLRAGSMRYGVRAVLGGMILPATVGCSDSMEPNLTDRWGGESVELDARSSAPVMRLACGVTVHFEDAIPLASDGSFNVQAEEGSPLLNGSQPVAVVGQVIGPNLTLTVVPSFLLAGTPLRSISCTAGVQAISPR